MYENAFVCLCVCCDRGCFDIILICVRSGSHSQKPSQEGDSSSVDNTKALHMLQHNMSLFSRESNVLA